MATYLEWLDNTPCEVRATTRTLMADADAAAHKLSREGLNNLGDVDIVVSGSSFLDRYYVGFRMVLDRLEGKLVNVKRVSGASSGANTPFDMMLMGEEAALNKYLTFGLVGARFPYVYYGGVADQSYWQAAADWTFRSNHSSQLAQLDDKMHMWMSCTGHCDWWQVGGVGCDTSKVLSKFDNAEVTKMAYHATQNMYPSVDVSPVHQRCSDGGAGRTFSDGLRPQITVSPTKALGNWGALKGYTMQEYADGVQAGQQAAIEFLRKGQVLTERGTEPIILCPEGSPCNAPEI